MRSIYQASFVKGLALFSLMMLGLSCSSGPSLQSYFVEKSEDANFISLTVPASILNIAVDSLAADEQAALATLTKLNVLIFKNTATDLVQLDAEAQTIQGILSNGAYTELMKLKAEGYQGSLSYMGSEGDIDEMIVYAKGGTEGFALIRIMGNGMNPKHIKPFITALQTSKAKAEDFKNLLPDLGL